MFLVVYAGRGLVIKTVKNMKLFDALYWLTLWVYTVISCAYILTNSDDGQKVFGYYVWFDTIVTELFEKKKRNYVKGQCLNRNTFAACGGKHRRNIFTCLESKIYFYLLQLCIFTEVILMPDLFDITSEATQSISIVFMTFLYVLYIPIRQLYISRLHFPEMFRRETKDLTPIFYVRKPDKLIPRDRTYKLILKNSTILESLSNSQGQGKERKGEENKSKKVLSAKPLPHIIEVQPA